MRVVLTALVALVALGTGARAAGAAITIELDAETTAAAAAMSLRLTAANTGTEAAHDVAPDVVWLDQAHRGDPLAALDPGARHRWDVALPAPPGAGTFPLLVRVRYADANGYPLSALLVHLARTAGATAGPVRATLSADPIAAFGRVHLRLENPGPRAVAGRVVVALPAEFSTDPESQAAQVPAQGHVELPLVVQNASALAGSAYPIYAVFEYDWDAVHQAVLGQATLRVVAVSAADRTVPLAIGAAALLAMLAVLALFWRRAARRQPPGCGAAS